MPESMNEPHLSQRGMLGAETAGAYRGLLRNRNYRLWFSATLGSALGDWVGLVALQALVISLAEPGSRLALFGLGGIMMARLLPSLIMGPIAGVLADRYDRKHVMVACDVMRGTLFIGVAFSRDLIALFALTFLIECLTLLYMAARDATLPSVVDRRHLTEANQLNLLVTYGPLPLGAVVAAAMVPAAAGLQALGVPVPSGTMLALLANAATFYGAALIISRLHLPASGRRASADEERPGVLEELREGTRFIRDLPLIRALIGGVVAVFFGAGVVITLGPELVRSSLGRSSEDWYGLMTFVGAGAVLGLLVTPFVTRRISKARLFPISLTGAGAVATSVAAVPSFRLAQGVGLLLGAFAGSSAVMGYTLLHEHTRDEVRAKTFATFYVTTRISMFAALGLAPFLAGGIGVGTLIIGERVLALEGVRITILLGGLVALLGALGAWRSMYRALADEVREATPRPVRLLLGGPGRARTGGLFVAFEGVEGSGKSTQVKALATALEAENRPTVTTREPGGAPAAERIRALLLDPAMGEMHPHTEALLYAAARAEHVQQVILPALAAGKIVLCDRFLDSSLAYQGFGRGLGETDVFEINRWAIQGVLPDVVILLHLDPAEGLARVAERARRDAPGGTTPLQWRGGDRIEREDLDFHRRVADGYLQLARHHRDRFVVVNADADAGTVARQVRSALHPWLPLPDRDRERGQRPDVAG
jgi:dTMP kinase